VSTLESRCRRLIRAYPPAYRQDRGDELITTLLDLAGPGQRRPGPRDTLDIVRGGLVTRCRQHPPVIRWLAYRLLDRALAPRWQAWAGQDLSGRWYLLRRALPWMSVYLLLAIALPVPGKWWFWPLLALLVPLGELPWISQRRRKALRGHGLRIDLTPISNDS
jgi:hypothetical protein